MAGFRFLCYYIATLQIKALTRPASFFVTLSQFFSLPESKPGEAFRRDVSENIFLPYFGPYCFVLNILLQSISSFNEA